MSNTQVVSGHDFPTNATLLPNAYAESVALQGQLYKRIIDAVIETSRADFEESGVDYSTIEQLQEVSGVFPALDHPL